MNYEPTDGGRASYAPNEKRDCTVRAFAIVCGLPYAESHSILKDAGRKNQHGVHFDTVLKIIGWRYRLKRRNDTDTTLRGFVEAHPTGRYIVLERGHALALVDGVIHDNLSPTPRSKVRAAWQFVGIK